MEARQRRSALRALATLAIGLPAVGCGMNGSQDARLRIRNAGATPIAQLTVLFPDDRIGFGDVAPGATTDYERVRNGVYAYGAFSFEMDGAIVTQPVIDWVGEEPTESGAFTYTLELAPRGGQPPFVRLVSVTQDE